MNKRITSICILGLSLLASCSCEKSGCPLGDNSCMRSDGPSVVQGNASYSHKTFEHPLKVLGNLHAKRATFGDLTVVGRAHLRECVVKGQTNVQDVLRAFKTEFKNRIIISEAATFDECTTNNIFVTKGYQAIEIHLTHGTIVQGSIFFEGHDGIVYLQGHSQIKGEVIGGKIVQK